MRSPAAPRRSPARRCLQALLIAACLVAGGAVATAGDDCGAFDPDHRIWTGLLSRHVHAGRVDYPGLARESPELTRYLQALGAVTRPCYDTWTRAQRLAFWIDVYNAFTVRLVLDHYPLRSIRELGLLPLAAFRQKIIPMPELRGATLSLNDVENDVLRGELAGEPRIHFAIVCASKSCPPLRSEAYRAPDLDRQLDEQARTFLADPTRNRVDAATRTLFLSSIFKWFRADFEAAAGTVPAYVAGYLAPAGAAVARTPGVTVRYLDYDWSLNDLR